MINLGKPPSRTPLFEGRVYCTRGWTFRISHIRENLWGRCSFRSLIESELPNVQANANAPLCTIGGLEGSLRHKKVARSWQTPPLCRRRTLVPRVSTRPRKASERREDMAAHYAISATEDDGVIRQRLLTRTTTTRGEPPLKKLLKKFISFASEVDKDSDNYLDCEKLYKSFVQELSTFELPLIKTKAVIDANKREQESFKRLQADLTKQITQAQDDIEDLKVQLEEGKIERQHKEECEAIRRLIGAQPPRLETQKALNELDMELIALEADNTAAARTLDIRKKQFSLLLHVVDDLQSTIEEEQKNPANLDSGTSALVVTSSDATVLLDPMVIDPA